MIVPKVTLVGVVYARGPDNRKCTIPVTGIDDMSDRLASGGPRQLTKLPGVETFGDCTAYCRGPNGTCESVTMCTVYTVIECSIRVIDDISASPP